MPAQGIARMLADGTITADRAASLPGQVQPASLDLRLGREAFRVRASFLPGAAHARRPARRLRDAPHRPLPAARCWRRAASTSCRWSRAWRCPTDVSAVANAKSSTGRLDLFTRLITDRGAEFDRIEAGYAGPLYAEISPRSFSVLVRAGHAAEPDPLPPRLGGARRRRAPHALDATDRLVNGAAHIAGGLAFSVDLEPRAATASSATAPSRTPA